jgi:hypothetical protein
MSFVLWLVALPISPTAAAGAAQDFRYVEIKLELDSTWHFGKRTNYHHFAATCVTSTNDWYISGDFSTNARVEYWFTGANILERRLITSGMYLERASEYISQKVLIAHSYPPAGQVYTAVHPAPHGEPVCVGVQAAVWLAFCSGAYLKQPTRQVPMPIGPSAFAVGYSDKTIVFEDDLGLPKSVKLYSTNEVMVCEYHVLQATNIFGRSFPLEFRIYQLAHPVYNTIRSNATDLVGRVISIKPGTIPAAGDGVWNTPQK